jgi:hypothetical protein
VLLSTGNLQGWHRVKIDQGTAWLAAADAKTGVTAPSGDGPTVLSREPPRLKINFSERDLLVSAPTLRLSGEAVDPERVQDLYIFVNDKKAFYKSNQDSNFGPTLAFDTTLELKKGKNRILVVARENKDLTSRAVLMVLRRDPASPAAATAATGP